MHRGMWGLHVKGHRCTETLGCVRVLVQKGEGYIGALAQKKPKVHRDLGV